MQFARRLLLLRLSVLPREIMCLNSSSNTERRKRKAYSDGKVEWANVPLDMDLDEGTKNDEPAYLQPQTTQHSNEEDAPYAPIVNDSDTSFHPHSDPSPAPLNSLPEQWISSTRTRSGRKPYDRKGSSRRNKTKAQRGEPRTKKPKPNPKPKIFPCKLGCEKSFVRNTDQERHCRTAAIHNLEKPWECPLCGTKFNRQDNLDQHLANEPKKCKLLQEEREAWGQLSAYIPTSQPWFQSLQHPY
ncbi:hypothetical protein B9Z19DRAFT_1154909 [Tuber borchii]|uniref:C2H2-type domain-containing protein n=1 Tax=Tuber borchii TaxID=42251 RepID=A0A2T6ZI18_TUBBO|nr:hypothetical protein B9Z19DRAFT_1154909 [Tuber borchii]